MIAVSRVIIVIFFDPGTQFPENEKIRYAIPKSTIIIIIIIIILNSQY